MDTMTTLKGETGRDARRRIRAGGHRLPTSGMAPGFVQGNLAILPKALAADFARFCAMNPKPCPLLGQSEPAGSSHDTFYGAPVSKGIDTRYSHIAEYI